MHTRSLDEIVRANLVRFREEAGIRQEAAAAAVGITRDGLAKMERGDRGLPKLGLLKQLANMYCRTVDDFYAPDPAPPNLDERTFIVPLALVDVPDDVMEQARAALSSLNAILRRQPPPPRALRPTMPEPLAPVPMPQGTVRPTLPKKRVSKDTARAPLTLPEADLISDEDRDGKPDE
jgi:DNA-binding XRE family transcriptional regulator